jgi:feruloyl esterase
MDHCGGGAGCDTFDKFGPIDEWVEHGRAPERIESSKLSAGKVVRTRPICAYPLVARYIGTGSIDDGANFACVGEATENKK